MNFKQIKLSKSLIDFFYINAAHFHQNGDTNNKRWMFYSIHRGTALFTLPHSRGGGAGGKSVRPASGRFGVRISATTDLRRKNRL